MESQPLTGGQTQDEFRMEKMVRRTVVLGMPAFLSRIIYTYIVIFSWMQGAFRTTWNLAAMLCLS